MSKSATPAATPSTDVSGWDQLTMAGDSGRRRGPELVYDRLGSDFSRGSEPASITGLFEGDYCRRCAAHFPALAPETVEDENGDPVVISGKAAHRRYHEWLDQQGNVQPTPLDELSHYSALKLKPENSGKDDPGTPHPWASQKELEKHRTRFMPKTAPTRAALTRSKASHNAAVEFIARFGISEDDARLHVTELRSKGESVDDISELTGIPGSLVLDLIG